MPTFAERLKRRAIDLIGGPAYRQSQERLVGLLDRAYRQGPALVPTESLLRQLGEVDQRLLDLFLRQQGYDILHGRFMGQLNLTEQDRLRVVQQSRWYYHFDSQYENAVTMWTDFGFGQQVEITLLDEQAAEVWDEMWTARRNAPLFKQRTLHDLSNDVIVDGEIFFVAWASTVDGAVTWRRFDTDEVVEIVYDGEDTDVPLFYKVRTGTGDVYFPDWMATEADLTQEWVRITATDRSARRADQMGQEIELNGRQERATDARIVHAAINARGGRGWPKFYRGVEWTQALRDHIGDHLTVAKAVATFVDEIITKGGSRGVDAIAAKFASSMTTSSDWTERNPSPATGSVITHDEAVKMERRPLTTGAGDAQTTVNMVVGQVSSATKVPAHWMGWPGALQNRATARETSRPFVEQLERYQQFWADVFRDMVEVTLAFAEKYNPEYAGGFETVEADVSFESPQLIPAEEIASIVTAITNAVMNGVADAAQGANVVNWLIKLSLVSLGAQNVTSILEPAQQEEPPTEAPGPQVPEQAEPEQAEPMAQLAAVIRQNARDGDVDWQAVAEWALGEVL